MKLLRSITLATSVAALFAASPLYAAGDTTTEQRSAPQQLGGPGASGSQSMQDEVGEPRSRAESATSGATTNGSVSEGISGSTGGQGQVDPVWTQSNEPPQPGDPAGSSSESTSGSADGSAAGSAGSGSTDPGNPVPLNSPNRSSSPSYER